MACVFVLGMAVIDHVFHLPAMPDRAVKFRASNYEHVVGGGAANAAAAIVRLGGEARLGARFGDDANGDAILGALADLGVDTSACRRTPGATTSLSSVMVDKDGERLIVNFRGAGLEQSTDWLDPSLLDDCGATLADTRWPEAAAKLMSLAAASGIPGVVDAEPPFDIARDIIDNASHLAFPAEGIRVLTGAEDMRDGLQMALDIHDAWMCVTDGEHGTHFTDGPEIAHVPSLAVDVVDTLGAGDVWHGAFALALAEGQIEAEAVRFANVTAALKCANGAGWDAFPTRAHVEERL